MVTNYKLLKIICTLCILAWCTNVISQKVTYTKGNKYELVHLGKRSEYLLPQVQSTFSNAMNFHRKFWNYKDSLTYIILSDFEDLGHGGAIAMPKSMVQLGIEPYGFAFSIIPSNERFQWLFNHELTHIVHSDKANSRDNFYRKIFRGKVRRSEEYPVSALWSYLTTPRWYAPRWFHEGIACFMETWMSGGLGRAMGYYDEMYFRSIVNENHKLYSNIGLETEGTTIDFQVGTNAYLYGTRFITYLSNKYGIDKLKTFYSRNDSSKAFFGKQFQNTYGRSVKSIWNEWTNFEYDFQKNNINILKEYPVTRFKPVTNKPLGNVSNLEWDSVNNKIYAAINYPGIISQISEIDVKTGKIRKITTLDSPQMYYSTSITFDNENRKIFFTEQNSKYRNLVEVDINTGRKKVVNKFTRTGDLVFNKKDKSIWGVQHDNGYAKLVKIPYPYTSVIPMYTVTFGKSIFDIAISNSCEKLIATLSGIKGEQSLIMFNLKTLEEGENKYETIYELEDNTLTQFSFSNDDSTLYGTSYYNGVSNIWSIALKDKSFNMVSNTETGFFMPLQISKDSLLVLKFFREGLQPGIIEIKNINEANSITYLGNLVAENHPEVKEWSLPPASGINEVTASQKPYLPIKEMKLSNAWPDIAGFKKTIVAGYRFEWKDILGLSDIQLFVAASPWSNYAVKQKIHLTADWKYWNWHFSAAYNKPHFYDLFGPTLRSRAGYSAGIDYENKKSNKKPLESKFGFGIQTYGDLEVLPQYQNIATNVKSLQTAYLSYGVSKLRKSLGGIQDETGYNWNASVGTYFVNNQFFPSIVSNQEKGFLIPNIRNSSFWIRNSIGQSAGSSQSVFSNFYFGGFGNNYIDWQPSEQYRDAVSFPGADINEIPARNYVKTMGEINIKPLRLRNVGTTWLYPTYIKSSLFGTHLLTNIFDDSTRKNYFNLGIQTDIQLVLFSYLKTTWSVGYARKYESTTSDKGRWMLSLKLLGD